MSVRVVRLKSRPSVELRIFPNVVYLDEDGECLVAFTTDQWAEMTSAVGVRLMPVRETVQLPPVESLDA